MDVYTKFSVGVHASKEMCEWATREHALGEHLFDRAAAARVEVEMLDDFKLFEEWLDRYDGLVEDSARLPFLLEVDQKNDRLFVYGDEGDDDAWAAAVFLQNLLKKFSPDQCVTLSYATVSAARRDEQGGGGLFITAKEIDQIDINEWLYEKRKTFEEKKEKEKDA